MNNNDFPTLTLKRFNSSFIDPATEAEYRAWSIEDRFPTMLMAGWLAVLLWCNTALSAYGFFPEASLPVVKLSFLLVVPWILVVLLVGHLRIFTSIAPLTAAATLCMTGFSAIEVGIVYTGSAGGIATALMLNILFTPFMRIWAGWALIGLTPSVVYGEYLIIQSVRNDELSLLAAWFLCVVPFVALLTAVFVNLMHDRRSRCNYRDQRIIDLQKARLEQAQGQIRRYIPPAVADQIIAGNEAAISEPKRQRVTVLFADIVGFTDIADRVEPEVMTEVLNNYMSIMADLIEQHGGTLNEFAGDGLMALFGAPDSMAPEDQARNAVQTAQAMQAKMPELNEQWRKLGLGAELKTRIGINTGMASVGSYGSQGRMTYTAIGLQTNIASRIESAAEPGQTLISDATYQLISDDITCEPNGEVDCKGVHFPVKVYRPIKA